MHNHRELHQGEQIRNCIVHGNHLLGHLYDGASRAVSRRCIPPTRGRSLRNHPFPDGSDGHCRDSRFQRRIQLRHTLSPHHQCTHPAMGNRRHHLRPVSLARQHDDQHRYGHGAKETGCRQKSAPALRQHDYPCSQFRRSLLPHRRCHHHHALD